MTETFNWAILADDGSVSDRFATREGAELELPHYPAGSTVEPVADPTLED